MAKSLTFRAVVRTQRVSWAVMPVAKGKQQSRTVDKEIPKSKAPLRPKHKIIKRFADEIPPGEGTTLPKRCTDARAQLAYVRAREHAHVPCNQRVQILEFCDCEEAREVARFAQKA